MPHPAGVALLESIMLIRKAYKFRLYPNQEQVKRLAVQFGHARFIYNWGLNFRQKYYAKYGKDLSYVDTSNMLPDLKAELEWLKDADSQVLQQKLKDLNQAYVNFFEGRAKYPKFKSKRTKQSVRYPQRFKINGNHVYLPKVGWVKTVFHRPILGKMKNCTVSKTKSGKYFVSIQIEVEIPHPDHRNGTVGVDVGLSHFAILSTGEKIDHPQYLRRAEKRLAKLQRRHSRKKKGSKRREKARLAVARMHEKVSNQRADFLHKLSRRLVDSYGQVVIEDLNISGMVKNHNLAKSVSDSGWRTFRRMLEYKGQWYGSWVETADRFFPSSKLCHICGYKYNNLSLSTRSWVCPACLTKHDRDINAAINLKNYGTGGVPETFNARGDRVRPVLAPARPAVVVEARSPSSLRLGYLTGPSSK